MSVESIELTLGNGLSADVLHAGQGEPLLFLHGRLGRAWDDYLDGLAASYSVYAPLHPGVNDETELELFDSVHDLVLYYDDLIGALGIERPVIVGHSFGGLVAAEYAAHFPEKVGKLVLIGALGLWQDEAPVADIDGVSPKEAPLLLFKDPARPPAASVLSLPTNPAEKAGAILGRMAVVAATNHFVWPIPDRNLGRRLYRIKSPTLLLWGADDTYVPVHYAERFSRALASSETVLVEDAGHHPHVEQMSVALERTAAFLKG